VDPVEKLALDKECQTLIEGTDAKEILADGELERIHEAEEKLRKEIVGLETKLEEKDGTIKQLKDGGKKKKKDKKQGPVQLTEEQVASVMSESEFSEFFTKTTKTMELVLQSNDEFDPTVDYT
jgi:hypothetical protein